MQLDMDTMPRSLIAWDKWERFYWEINYISQVVNASNYSTNPITVFDTGEVVLGSLNVDDRGTYTDLGIGIHGTNDSHCPTLYWGERKVPKAWLNQGGQQILLVDYDHKIAVRAEACSPPRQEIPGNLRKRVTAYYPDPTDRPIGGSAIKLARPMKVFDDATKAEIDDKLAAAKMYAELTGRGLQHRIYTEAGIDPLRLLAVATVDELSDAELAHAHKNGAGRGNLMVDHLTLEPTK